MHSVITAAALAGREIQNFWVQFSASRWNILRQRYAKHCARALHRFLTPGTPAGTLPRYFFRRCYSGALRGQPCSYQSRSHDSLAPVAATGTSVVANPPVLPSEMLREVPGGKHSWLVITISPKAGTKVCRGKDLHAVSSIAHCSLWGVLYGGFTHFLPPTLLGCRDICYRPNKHMMKPNIVAVGHHCWVLGEYLFGI